MLDQLIKTTAGQNMLVETSVDLGPAMAKANLGHAIAVVEPYPWKERYEPPRIVTWVQSTRLAVDAYVDADNLIAHVSELATGKPAAGVALELAPFGIKATSDDKGMATLALGAGGAKGAHYLIARRGDDVAFVSEDGGYWNDYGPWVKTDRPSQLAWYVIDDRKMYKPGEEVTLKGWLRVLDPGKNGDSAAPPARTSPTRCGLARQRDRQGLDPSQRSRQVRYEVPLPTPNLGYAYVDSGPALTGSYTHGFQTRSSGGRSRGVGAGQPGPVPGRRLRRRHGDAKYYSGGPLPGAPVIWNVNASQTSFTPPNRDEYIFGRWQPWWGYRGWWMYGDDDGQQAPKSFTHEGKTDATGAHVLHMDFLTVNPPFPVSLSANASVTDVNRQTWSASAALIVHPSQYGWAQDEEAVRREGHAVRVDVIGWISTARRCRGRSDEAVRLDWSTRRAGTRPRRSISRRVR